MKKKLYDFSTLEAIIFDFDGVLADSTEIKTEAFRDLYSVYGKKISEDVVNYHIQNFGVSRYVKFKYIEEVILNNVYNENIGQELSKRFSKLVFEKVVSSNWINGAKEFLEHYYKKLPLFIASGTPNDELIQIVKSRNMMKYFISVHGTPSTKTEIIENIIKLYSFDKKKVLMIGDAFSDFNAALETGIHFLGKIVEHNDIFDESVFKFKDFTFLL